MTTMMKYYLLLVAMSLLSAASTAQIQFQPFDINILKLSAKKQNKLILLNFTASWCTPCQTMKRETFLNVEVGNFYNTHFICSQVDTDKNKSFASGFDVDILPDFVVLNSKGEEIYRFGGYQSAEAFLEKGYKALKAQESGDKPLQKLEWCADSERWQHCDDALKQFLTSNEWKTPAAATLLLQFARQHNKIAMLHYTLYRAEYEKLVEPQRYQNFRAAMASIVSIPLINNALALKTAPNWTNIQDSITHYVGSENMTAFMTYNKSYYYLKSKDWVNYFKLIDGAVQEDLKNKDADYQVKIYKETIYSWIDIIENENEEEEINPQGALGIGLTYIYEYLKKWEALEHSKEVYELLIGITESLDKQQEADFYYELWQNAQE